MMLEKDIVRAIMKYLKTVPRCFVWKEHGGMYGTAGIPDIIYKLGQNDFLCAAADAVHAAYPFHLIGRFECFCHPFLLYHCRNENLHTLVAELIDLGKVPMQRSACEQICVEDRMMLFQIAAAHTPILADLALRFIRQCKVRDNVITILTVSAAHFFIQRFH